MLVSLPLHCCSSVWIEINIKLQIVLFVGRMIFLVSIGILRTWGRGAGVGDTSKAFHRILIDATLKAFRSRIHGNLKNPISQLRPLLLREVEQKANFTHPTLVKLQNLCPFLAFFARIWLWKLDSGQVGSLWKFCQAKLFMPGQWEKREGGIKTESFMWNICAAACPGYQLPWKYISQYQSFSSVIRRRKSSIKP